MMIDPYRKKDENPHLSKHTPMESTKDCRHAGELLEHFCAIDHDRDSTTFSWDPEDGYDDCNLDSHEVYRSTKHYKLHPTGKQR
jgi:hypothetical protein